MATSKGLRAGDRDAVSGIGCVPHRPTRSHPRTPPACSSETRRSRRLIRAMSPSSQTVTRKGQVHCAMPLAESMELAVYPPQIPRAPPRANLTCRAAPSAPVLVRQSTRSIPRGSVGPILLSAQ
eukprot:scaffold123748_cov32-Tisochrysis_lutea.AAC.4